MFRSKRMPTVVVALFVLVFWFAPLGVGSAGAATSSSVSQVATKAVALELGGYFPQVWSLLDRSDIKGIDEGQWMACQRQSIATAFADTTITSIKVVGQHTTTQSVAPLGRTKVTVLDITISYKNGKKAHRATAPLTMRDVGGKWKGLLTSGDYKALKAGNCPQKNDNLSGYWFETPTRWSGAGSWDVSTALPDYPLGQGSGAESSTEYDYSGDGSDALSLTVRGPDYEGGAHTLQGAADEALQTIDGGAATVSNGPVKTTMGGIPAAAYSGTDTNGHKYELIVSCLCARSINAFEAGTYTIELSGPPANFDQQGAAAIDAVAKGFVFLVLPDAEKFLPRVIPPS
ncbi:MAG: hypothetical protein ACRDVW_01220 [Acidimicrobiales bacterium]